MKRIIYRVDDRFIHGQVIEGWINYYNISNIILVNDYIANDITQSMIYKSVIPFGKTLQITTVFKFLNNKLYQKFKKGSTLIILGSIDDMYAIRSIIDKDSYINIGCIATGNGNIEITDTVYINNHQLEMLKEISISFDVFVHKLPWDMPVNIKGFNGYPQEDK